MWAEVLFEGSGPWGFVSADTGINALHVYKSLLKGSWDLVTRVIIRVTLLITT